MHNLFLKNLFICCLYVACTFTHNPEYVYPVCCIQNKVLVVEQCEGQPELYAFDVQEMTYEKILSSHYVPSLIMPLPDNSGFSFLDDGRVRIKYFCKRGVRTIDIFEPIYAIGGLQWIDAHACIFHAREGSHYGIYKMNIDGEIEKVLHDDCYDFLYPQMDNAVLFYITHDHGMYAVWKCNAQCAHDRTLLIKNEKKSMMFLQVINDHELFYIEAPDNPREHNFISFSFCHAWQEKDGAWQNEKLFKFVVPNELLFDDEVRLYESILPLTPVYFEGNIYYSSAEKPHETMVAYRYDMIRRESHAFLKVKELEDCFGIICVPDKVFIGGKKLHSISYN